MISDEEWRKAHDLAIYAKEPEELALAVLLLTSPVKAERERGKEMARGWKKAAIKGDYYRPKAINEEKP